MQLQVAEHVVVLQEILLRDVPGQAGRGEEGILVVLAELGGAIVAPRGGYRVAVFIRIRQTQEIRVHRPALVVRVGGGGIRPGLHVVILVDIGIERLALHPAVIIGTLLPGKTRHRVQSMLVPGLVVRQVRLLLPIQGVPVISLGYAPLVLAQVVQVAGRVLVRAPWRSNVWSTC